MDNNERFIRWHAVLRDQLTFLNSLLLTISVGIIGYVFSLLNSQDFNLICCQKVFFTFGIILIFISFLMGLLTAISRLLDFRTTVKKIREETKSSDQGDLKELKELMDLYGKTTWIFFYSQIITFGIGTINLIIAFCWIYKDKLF